MAIDLSEQQYIDALKRQVIPLGSDAFATIEDEQWVGYLTDAFWEARLDGFMLGYVADEDGEITSSIEGMADLDRKYIALIALYAGIKVLRNQILNTNTAFRAKAGPVEYEQENSAQVLAEMLKQLRAAKDKILEQLEAGVTLSHVLDALSTRLYSVESYYGSPELMG